MKIEVPRLSTLGMLRASVCLRIPLGEQGATTNEILALREAIPDDGVKFPTGRGTDKQFVWLFLVADTSPAGEVDVDGNAEDAFLHCHIVTPLFLEGMPVEKCGDRASVERVLEVLKGRNFGVLSMGTVRVRVSDLPATSIVRVASISQESDKVSMKLVSGKVRITGTPFNYLEWKEVDEKSQTIDVTMKSQREVELDSDYIVNCLQLIKTGLDTLVLT